jgi:hypothetical protein
MISRREAVRLWGSASAGAWIAAAQMGLDFSMAPQASAAAKGDATPPLAPGAPERLALIEAFKKQSEGLEKKFEARTYKCDWVMPYRLFRPEAAGKLPLVVYLNGSGGLGDDNLRQLGLGNIFGTRVWLLPENQKLFSCYVIVLQTDRGWARYDFSQQTQEQPKVLSGLGKGPAWRWRSLMRSAVSSPSMIGASMSRANRWEARARGISSPIVRNFSPPR